MTEPTKRIPVLNPDGRPKQFLLRNEGKPFRCECGANVFHKPDANDPELYQCNGCANRYRGEPA